MNFKDIFMQEFNALAQKTQNNVGISLDLDGLNPDEIIAVGTPEAGGIAICDFLDVMSMIDFNQLIAFEISEYNPFLDNAKTLEYIMQVIMLIKKKFAE